MKSGELDRNLRRLAEIATRMGTLGAEAEEALKRAQRALGGDPEQVPSIAELPSSAGHAAVAPPRAASNPRPSAHVEVAQK